MTSASMEPDSLRGLVRQHALTAQLLGVDFVPVFRRPGSEPVMPAVETPAASTAGSTPEPRPAAAGGESARPARPRASPSAPSSVPRVVPSATAGSSAPNPDEVPPVRSFANCGDSERERRQKLLDDLRARYEREAPHSKFVTDHHNIVFGEGDPCARLVFVGEAPGADEDRTGRPFVGRAGQLLQKMITAMGLAREQVYITNVLKTRPPNNATPTIEEMALLAPWLMKQLEIIQPEVIVALGLPATRTLLGIEAPMARLRGRFHRLGEGHGIGGLLGNVSDLPEIPVMPTYHPAFLLRAYTPENRAKVWSDLKQVCDRLGLPTKGG